jgi:hypothetical protein
MNDEHTSSIESQSIIHEIWFGFVLISVFFLLGSFFLLVFINSTQGFPTHDGYIRYELDAHYGMVVACPPKVMCWDAELADRPHLTVWLIRRLADHQGSKILWGLFWRKLIDIPWFPYNFFSFTADPFRAAAVPCLFPRPSSVSSGAEKHGSTQKWANS